MIWTIYINQKNILINLRSDEMISIAKISANKLKDYFEDKVEFLDNVFQVENELLEYGLNIEQYIENKILIMKEKNEGYDGYIKYIPYELCADYDVEKYSFGECIVGPVLLNEDSNYIIQIIKPIVINNEVKGIVLAEYLLDEVYEETLGKIQVGQYGYCTLKDMTGAILMHGDKNQIGLDSLNDRKKRYPKLSHKEIDRLVTNQLSGNPGSDIIKSYWWGEDEVKQVKKIIGYAPVEIGEYKWVVSAITSYNEIAIPIAKTFYFILATGIILLILIVSFIVYIIKTKNEKQKMILELKYSEEINKATSMLRKHEEKLSKTNSIHTLGMMASAIAHELLTADDAVAGIKAEGKDKNYTINAQSVILATGGFGANEDMYTKYRPELKGFVTTNTPGATGDGIAMAEAVGANLVDIEKIQTHPTVEQTTSLLITESVRGGGAILVNEDAKRFGNELLTRDVVSANIIAEEGGYAYEIFDQQLRDSLSAIEKYVESNIVVQADTIEELAKELGLDEATLVETVNTWNEAVANQNDPEFGRTTGMEKNISVAPFYAIKIAPGVHHTMGGVEINTNAEVVSTEGTVIPGLFAAGEVAGGVHGGNRIGGTAVTDFVIFGRIAGQSAGKFVTK